MEYITGRIRGEMRSIKHSFFDNIKDNKVLYSLLFLAFVPPAIGMYEYSRDKGREIKKAMITAGTNEMDKLAGIVCSELGKHSNLADLARVCSKDLTKPQIEAYNRIVNANFVPDNKNLYK